MLGIKKNQRGETIIEVLLALSILGLVLGISYASASRSMRASQDAHERTAANQIAQSLIEITKYYAGSGHFDTNPHIFPTTPSSDFCVSTVPNDVRNREAPVQYNAASPHAYCQHGINGLYTARVRAVDVTPATPADAPDTYEYIATVTWDGLSGVENQTTIRYRQANTDD